MSKILISVSSISDLSLPADGYVLGYEKYTLFAAHRFTFEEIKSIKDRNVFVLMNALIHEKDLEDAKKEVDRLISLGVNFIVQDFGLLNYLLSKISPNKILFFPYTLICNKEELLAYRERYPVAINISNELTLEEMQETISGGGAVVNLFGYTPIYQSYRKILSLYKKEKGLTLPDNIFLKENTRNEKYPVFENEYGSVIFRSSPNSYLEDYQYLKNAEYLFVDSLNIDHDLFVKIVNMTHKVINGQMNREEVLKAYQEIGFVSQDGFKYRKTVLRK